MRVASFAMWPLTELDDNTCYLCEASFPDTKQLNMHMMEHLPGLEPAWSNMLRLAKKRLVNIFFIPPKAFDGYEVVNYKQYPLYHNTYGIGHIEAVCKANGFGVRWIDFGKEVVVVAEWI